MRSARLVVGALTAILGATVVAGPVSGSVAGPVSAADPRPTSVEVQDGRHDVRRVTEIDDDFDPSYRVDRRRAAGDITVVRVLHRADAVVVRVRMRELGRLAFGPVVMFRTPAARVSAVYGPAENGGSAVAVSDNRSGDTIDCPGATAQVRRSRASVELTVPRSCLGDPSWVRARAISFSFGPNRKTFTYFVDIAPGDRLRLKGNLSTRAYAPAGSAVVDGPPPVAERSASRTQSAPSTALRRLGLLG